MRSYCHRCRSNLRETSGQRKYVDDVYQLTSIEDTEARYDHVKWLLDDNRFVCADDRELRQSHANHFMASELPELIYRIYVASKNTRYGYCTSVRDFIDRINGPFVCLVAVAIMWRLREWKAGRGVTPTDIEEFAVEKFQGRRPQPRLIDGH